MDDTVELNENTRVMFPEVVLDLFWTMRRYEKK